MANDVQGRNLSTAYLHPLYLRIGKFNGERAIYRACHYYWAANENQLDLFRANPGDTRLERFASFNNVSFVEEIEALPEDEALLIEEPSAEVVSAPAKPTSDDDFPF